MRPLLVLLVVLFALSWATGAHFIVRVQDFRCPDGYVPRPIGPPAGTVRCEANGTVRPDNSDPLIGTDTRNVALYLTNLQLRMFDFDFVSNQYLGLGLNVTAPSSQ